MLQTTSHCQVAMMRLGPNQATGDSAEAHPHSDQVLLVLDGEIEGDIEDKHLRVCKDEFVVIPAGAKHRFFNPERKTALTFNVYAAPEYPPGSKG